MDLKLDPYTIGGVVAISAGGYLIIKAYNNYGAVSVWNSIGMVTIGSALVWGGVRIFSAKSTGEKKKETAQIKEDVTKAIAAVGEESAEVAAAEFTQSQREKLAKKGHALADGSFPIRNKQDLKNAVKSWGLAKKSNKAKAKKFIKLRAKQLGAMNEIPSTW